MTTKEYSEKVANFIVEELIRGYPLGEDRAISRINTAQNNLTQTGIPAQEVAQFWTQVSEKVQNSGLVEISESQNAQALTVMLTTITDILNQLAKKAKK